MDSLELILQDCIRACDREETLSGQSIYSDAFLEINEPLKSLVTRLFADRYKSNRPKREELVELLSQVKTVLKNRKFQYRELSRLKCHLEKIYQSFNGIPCTSEIKNGDELRNVYSYEYLRYLADTIPDNLKYPLHHVLDTSHDGASEISPIFRYISEMASDKYDPNLPYGDNFTAFLIAFAKLNKKVEEEVEALRKQSKDVISAREIVLKKHGFNQKQIQMYNELCYRSTANRNLAIERAYGMVHHLLQGDVKQTSHRGENIIRDHLIGESDSIIQQLTNYFNLHFHFDDINQITPQGMSTSYNETAIFSSEYAPQYTTGLPSVRDFEYKTELDPQEIGIGTQGQFEDDMEGVNPNFEEYLVVQKINKDAKPDNQKRKITHIYFNNLPTYRPGFFDSFDFSNIAGQREVRLTNALHRLESKHENIAVITLPSAKGLLSESHLEKREKNIEYTDAYEAILSIAKDTTKKNDFYISPNIKQLLFGKGDKNGEIYNNKHEDKKLRELLDKSFEVLGFDADARLSSVDRQAVFFHFIKFELTHHIIKKIGPESINFSCKDGIDRGSVSSAYYNLVKSIESGKPMSQKEFERSLHGRSTVVKGRGMNANSKLIWNAINGYIAGHDKKINNNIKTAIPVWLREWHSKNAIRNLKEQHICKLEKYQVKISTEKKQSNNWYSFYNTSTKSKKHDLAKKILSAQNKITMLHGKQVTLELKPDELEQLDNGRLKKIVSDLENDGILRIIKSH